MAPLSISVEVWRCLQGWNKEHSNKWPVKLEEIWNRPQAFGICSDRESREKYVPEAYDY